MELPNKLFVNLPSVFLIDLCRMQINPTGTTDQFVMLNYSLSFPSMLLMDRFLMKNAEQVSAIGTILRELELVKESVNLKIKSLAPLLEYVPQLITVFQSYQRSFDASAVDFGQLDREMEEVQSCSLSTCRPYQVLRYIRLPQCFKTLLIFLFVCRCTLLWFAEEKNMVDTTGPTFGITVNKFGFILMTTLLIK